VLPSDYETFSLAAHEAAASAIPVVATRVSGVEDLVGDRRAGLLVERRADEFAAAIDRLAGDPSLRARMGEEGRRRASALTWDHAVSSILAVYDDLLDRRMGPPA
jgi:glycosyltransferase involved in cell wall biosynthesis